MDETQITQERLADMSVIEGHPEWVKQARETIQKHQKNMNYTEEELKVIEDTFKATRNITSTAKLLGMMKSTVWQLLVKRGIITPMITKKRTQKAEGKDKRGKLYSEKTIADVLNLYKRNNKVNFIAKTMGMPTSSVYNILIREGIFKSSQVHIRTEKKLYGSKTKILQLRTEGYKPKEIANKLKLSKSLVYNYLSKYKRRRAKWQSNWLAKHPDELKRGEWSTRPEVKTSPSNNNTELVKSVLDSDMSTDKKLELIKKLMGE